MPTKRYEIGYDENGRRYEYELDPDIVIRIDKKVVTEKEDPRTKSKRSY